MRDKILFNCTLLAFIIWAIPFLFALLFPIQYYTTAASKKNLAVERIMSSYQTGKRKEVFSLIFINNEKIALTNIFGGIMLGIGTVVNLIINGLYFGGMISGINSNGEHWDLIIKYTAPHSFEMLGIWLSGGMGLY